MPQFRIDIIGAFAQFSDALDQVNRKATKTGNDITKAFSSVRNVMSTLGLSAAGVSLGAVFTSMIRNATEAEQASLKLTNTIRSTGSAAGVTKDQIDDLADALARTTQFDDESIRNAASELLIFRNVQGEVFTETLKLSADVAAAMGTAIPEAAAKLGRSLEDPDTAFGLLRRQGILLTEQQKDSIKAMGDLGDKAGQQRVILEKLQQAYGGMAETLNTGLNKGAKDVSKSWGELLEAFGKTEAVQGTTENVLRGLSRVLDRIKETIESGNWFDRLRQLATPGFGGLIAGIQGSMERGRQRPDIAGTIGQEEAELGAAMGAARQRAEQIAEAAYVKERERLKKLKEEREAASKSAARQAISEAAAAQEAFKDRLRSINDATRGVFGADSEAEKVKALVEQDKVFSRLSVVQKNLLVEAAKRLDAEKSLLLVLTQQAEAQEQLDRDTAEAFSFLPKMQEQLKEREFFENIFGEERLVGMSIDQIKELHKATIDAADTMVTFGDAAALAFAGFDESGKFLGDGLEKTRELAKDLGLTFTSAFEDAVIGGKKFRDVLNGIAADIGRLLLRETVTKPIVNAIGDFLPSILGSFSGQRAGGGSVSAGRGYLVGELGPELFVPNVSGSIMPNSQLAMAGGVTVINNNDFRGVDPMAVANMDRKLAILERTTVSRVRDAQRRTV